MDRREATQRGNTGQLREDEEAERVVRTLIGGRQRREGIKCSSGG